MKIVQREKGKQAENRKAVPPQKRVTHTPRAAATDGARFKRHLFLISTLKAGKGKRKKSVWGKCKGIARGTKKERGG